MLRLILLRLAGMTIQNANASQDEFALPPFSGKILAKMQHSYE